MLHQFYPDYEGGFRYGIDYRTLYEIGVSRNHFDIDNTLVPHGGTGNTAGNRVLRQIAGTGISTLLLSNKEPRVKVLRMQ